MKRCQKIWAGSSPPLIWTKSKVSLQKKIFFAKENFPLKCICAPATKFRPKVPPQKARIRDKAKFATKLRKLRKDCVNEEQ